MTPNLMETLESRCLLSASILAPGGVALFDGNQDIIQNTGASAISYTYTSGQGLDSVDISANGGSFLTNAFVTQVGDSLQPAGLSLGNSKVSVNMNYGGHSYRSVSGASSVSAGAIATFEDGGGNLVSATTTTGAIGTITLDNGSLGNVTSAAGIGSLLVNGDLTGSVYSPAGITEVSVNNLPGSITAAGAMGELLAQSIAGGNVTVGTNMTLLNAHSITGTAAGTYISVGGQLATLDAGTISAGNNGTLYIAMGATINNINATDIDGGSATAGGMSYAEIDVSGNLTAMNVGTLSGGQASDAGSNAGLMINVDANGTALGDVDSLTANTISTGQAAAGASAGFTFNIAHDLQAAWIGQITGLPTSGGNSGGGTCGTSNGGSCGSFGGGFGGGGFGCAPHNCGPQGSSGQQGSCGSGGSCGSQGSSGSGSSCGSQGSPSSGSSCGSQPAQGSCDPWVMFNVGDDIIKFQVGTITPGTAAGAGDSQDIIFNVGNDLENLTANAIDGGTASGAGSITEVSFIVGRDIDAVYAGTIAGGEATGSGADAGVFFDAGRDISLFSVSLLSGSGLNGTVTAATPPSSGQQGCGGQSSCGGAQTCGGYTGWGNKPFCGGSNCGGSSGSGCGTSGSSSSGCGSGSGSAAPSCGDPVVQVLAHRNIVTFQAGTVQGGADGLVNVLAGLDDSGNELGGEIMSMTVNTIIGDNGAINIAADGNIVAMKVGTMAADNGTINVIAAGNITAAVYVVENTLINGVNSIQFEASGTVDDVLNTIPDSLTSQDTAVTMPDVVEVF